MRKPSRASVQLTDRDVADLSIVRSVLYPPLVVLTIRSTGDPYGMSPVRAARLGKALVRLADRARRGRR